MLQEEKMKRFLGFVFLIVLTVSCGQVTPVKKATSDLDTFIGQWLVTLESDNAPSMYMVLSTNSNLYLSAIEADVAVEGKWALTKTNGKSSIIISATLDGSLMSEVLDLISVTNRSMVFLRSAQYTDGKLQEATPTKMTANLQISELASFKSKDYYGFRNLQTKKVVVQPKYSSVYPISDYLMAGYSDSKWMVLDNAGKEVFEVFTYDNGPDYFTEGLARFVQDGKMGFFDETGKIVIPAQFDFVYPFENGTAQFVNGGKKVSDGEHSTIQGGKGGTVDKQGKITQ